MKEVAAKEITDLLKQLSPQNQAYFMTLVRIADRVENSFTKSSDDSS